MLRQISKGKRQNWRLKVGGRRSIIFYFLSSICFAFSFLTPNSQLLSPVFAAQLQGITITPPLNSLSIPEGTPSIQQTIIIANHTETTVNLELSARDFGGADKGGGVLFLGTESNVKWDKYRLAKWMRIEPQTLNLTPGEQAEVRLTISNDNSLSPGGHYAAVIAEVKAAQNKSAVALNHAVSSLLFVNKSGGEVYGVSVQTVTAALVWWGQIKQVAVNLTNTGNTHVTPRGHLTVTDPLGRQIARGILNQTSTLLLPNSQQTFITPLTSQGLPLWPGTYRLTLAYRHDGQDTFATTTKDIFAPGIVGIIGIALTAILGGWWLMGRVRRGQKLRQSP